MLPEEITDFRGPQAPPRSLIGRPAATDNSLYTRWGSGHGGTWSDEQHLGGKLNGDPIAAQVPGTNILQLFYRGTDNSVWTRWRNEDGSWSSEQDLGGKLNGDPIAFVLFVAQVMPVSNVLRLFYRGTDNAVWSRWRNEDGSWSSEQRIGGVLNGNPIAAGVPDSSEIMQVFYRGTDNSLYTRYTLGTTWSNEQKLGGILTTDPIAIAVPITPAVGTPGGGVAWGLLAVFYRGADNSLWTHWRNTDGSWWSETYLGGALNGKPSAAVLPGTGLLQLFYRDTNNALRSRWRNDDGSWSDELFLAGTLNGDPIAITW